MKKTRFVFLLLFGAVALLTSGCGPSGPKVVTAKGTVLYQGKPLVGATVTLLPKDEQSGPVLAINGSTDAEGRFSLKTFVSATAPSEGVPPGEYRVTISKYVPPNGMTEEEYQEKVKAEENAVRTKQNHLPNKVESLPPKYSDGKKTELKASIPGGGNGDLKFDLK